MKIIFRGDLLLISASYCVITVTSDMDMMQVVVAFGMKLRFNTTIKKSTVRQV